MKYFILFVLFFQFDFFGFYNYQYKSKPMIKIDTKEYRIYIETFITNKEVKGGLFFIKYF